MGGACAPEVYSKDVEVLTPYKQDLRIKMGYGIIHILCSIKIEVRWTPPPYVTLFFNVNSMAVTLGS
jgi:hypothetical protein